MGGDRNGWYLSGECGWKVTLVRVQTYRQKISVFCRPLNKLHIQSSNLLYILFHRVKFDKWCDFTVCLCFIRILELLMRFVKARNVTMTFPFEPWHRQQSRKKGTWALHWTCPVFLHLWCNRWKVIDIHWYRVQNSSTHVTLPFFPC